MAKKVLTAASNINCRNKIELLSRHTTRPASESARCGTSRTLAEPVRMSYVGMTREDLGPSDSFLRTQQPVLVTWRRVSAAAW
jgi:hypothetical protein